MLCDPNLEEAANVERRLGLLSYKTPLEDFHNQTFGSKRTLSWI